jgi:hypothetical protein
MQGNSTRLCSSLSPDTVRAISFASCASGSPLSCLTFSKTTQLNTQGFLRSLLQFILSCRKEVGVEIEARSADFCGGFFHLQYLPESEKVASLYIILPPSAIDSISEHSEYELLILLRKYFPVITVYSTGYLSLPWHIAMGPAMGIRGCDGLPFCRCITTTKQTEQNDPYYPSPLQNFILVTYRCLISTKLKMVSWAITGATRGIGVSYPRSTPLPHPQMLIGSSLQLGFVDNLVSLALQL